MKIVIIGAQAAGMTCAARLKRNLKDCTIKIFERANYISFGACGLPYFVADYFSDANNLFAKQPEDFKKLGIDIFLQTEVLRVDNVSKIVYVKDLESQKEYQESYDKLLIATGSRARDFPSDIIGSNSGNIDNKIIALKTLEEAKVIKDKLKSVYVKNLAILGSGYIGLEMLELKKQYPDVNIIILDAKSNISDNFIDIDFEDILQNEIKEHNIDIKLNSKVIKVEVINNQVIISITRLGSDKVEHINIDLLITAIGFIPNSDFLENLPLDKLPNGAIKVNSKGETNLKDIYACGDVSAVFHDILQKHMYISLATLANKMGRVIGDNIAGIDSSMPQILGSSSLRLLNLEIAKTGITESEAIRHNIKYKSIFVKDYNHTNYYHNKQEIFAKIIMSEDKKRILGATLVGKDGVALRAHALTVAIASKISPLELGMIDFAYSPTFTRTWEFLNVVGNVAAKA